MPREKQNKTKTISAKRQKRAVSPVHLKTRLWQSVLHISWKRPVAKKKKVETSSDWIRRPRCLSGGRGLDMGWIIYSLELPLSRLSPLLADLQKRSRSVVTHRPARPRSATVTAHRRSSARHQNCGDPQKLLFPPPLSWEFDSTALLIFYFLTLEFDSLDEWTSDCCCVDGNDAHQPNVEFLSVKAARCWETRDLTPARRGRSRFLNSKRQKLLRFCVTRELFLCAGSLLWFSCGTFNLGELRGELLRSQRCSVRHNNRVFSALCESLSGHWCCSTLRTCLARIWRG